ncbi:MAG: glycosyltransferase family 4 protein [Pyrinomonadaceae bacterium]|nr:glycosyltransferase family 4 protein [Pyrinomonadaceae bacterium]
MKILFYNHQGKVSGAERIILLILKKLNRSRFEPVMVCPETDTMAAETQELGVPCQTINQFEARFTLHPDELLRYFTSFIKTMRQLRANIRKLQPDLIHANSIRSGLVATTASIGIKIPVIWHLQDELPRHPLSILIRLFAVCSGRIRLMPVSRATGESFRGRIPQLLGKHLQGQIVHNGIELEKFEIDRTNRRRIRTELDLSENELVIGIVGQITPRKGQLELLQTFAATQKQMPSTLLVVGTPVFNRDYLYLEKLIETVKNLGIENRVRFLGARRDVAAIMQSLDALVINSKSEALVLVAIEAMACRTPVIATDVGGTSEIITHKENGWLVSFGNKRALADALATVGSEPELRRQFADEGEKIVASRLNAEHFINQVEDFYRQCTAGEMPAMSKNFATHS